MAAPSRGFGPVPLEQLAQPQPGLLLLHRLHLLAGGSTHEAELKPSHNKARSQEARKRDKMFRRNRLKLNSREASAVH